MAKKCIVLTAGLLLASSVFAGGEIGSIVPSCCTKVVTVSGGPAWFNARNSQTFTTPTQFSFVSRSRDHAIGSFEIFFSLQHQLNYNLFGQLGFAGAYSGNAKVDGHLTENFEGSLYTYPFTYMLKHGRVSLKGALFTQCYQYLQPYVSSSIGIAFNQSYNFSAPSTLYPNLRAPVYPNNTNSGFVYTLGTGLQTLITPNLKGGIGYEFADWGKSHLSVTSNQLVRALRLDHLYTNQVVVSLSFVA